MRKIVAVVTVLLVIFAGGWVVGADVTASGTDDAVVYWTTSTSGYDWYFGIDGSDDGTLKLGNSATFGSNDQMWLDDDGVLVLQDFEVYYGGTILNESGGLSDFRVEGDASPYMLFVKSSVGRVGIGTSSPDTTLHVYHGASGANPNGTAEITCEDDGDNDYNCAALQLLSPRYNYVIFGDDDDNDNGQIIYRHSVGANYYNDLIFKVNGSNQPLHINKNGIFIFECPASDPGNEVFAQLWSETVSGEDELRVRDTDNNATTISPHNFSLFDPADDDPLPFSFYSKNPYIGKEINVDMSGAIMEIERITGKKFIYLRDLPAAETVDLDADIERLKVKSVRDAKERFLRENLLIEISFAESWHEVPEVECVDSTVSVSEYAVDWNAMKVVEVEVEREEVAEILTGRIVRQLRPGVQFDSATGKFHRPRVMADIVLDDDVLSRIESIGVSDYVRERAKKVVEQVSP